MYSSCKCGWRGWRGVGTGFFLRRAAIGGPDMVAKIVFFCEFES